MRPLVQEPMNTVSTGTSRSGVPAVRPMYSRARAADSRALGSSKASGSGTAPLSSTTWAGLVPHDTNGSSAAGVEHDLLVEGRTVVGGERAPGVERLLPGRRRSGAWRRPSR